MGRIKSTLIKKASRQLIEKEHPFNSDFQNNKQMLKQTMPSKKMRNKIAGYIARLMKQKAV